jgi:hypothetical protein
MVIAAYQKRRGMCRGIEEFRVWIEGTSFTTSQRSVGFCHSLEKMTKQQLDELWPEVRFEFLTLRPLFDSSPEGVAAIEQFDQYVSHNEPGFAFQTLCDFLIESEASAISQERFAQIQRMHSKMRMEDDGFIEILSRGHLRERLINP